MAIEKTVGDKPMTCFSKNAVTSCRSQCLPKSLKTRKVKFVCLSTENPSTERLVSRYGSGFGDITEELSQFDSSFEEDVDIPDKCVLNYWNWNAVIGNQQLATRSRRMSELSVFDYSIVRGHGMELLISTRTFNTCIYIVIVGLPLSILSLLHNLVRMPFEWLLWRHRQHVCLQIRHPTFFF